MPTSIYGFFFVKGINKRKKQTNKPKFYCFLVCLFCAYGFTPKKINIDVLFFLFSFFLIYHANNYFIER